MTVQQAMSGLGSSHAVRRSSLALAVEDMLCRWSSTRVSLSLSCPVASSSTAACLSFAPAKPYRRSSWERRQPWPRSTSQADGRGSADRSGAIVALLAGRAAGARRRWSASTHVLNWRTVCLDASCVCGGRLPSARGSSGDDSTDRDWYMCRLLLCSKMKNHASHTAS